MKIQGELHQKVRDAVIAICEINGIERLRQYRESLKNDPRVKDLDAHIDTVLRQVMV